MNYSEIRDKVLKILIEPVSSDTQDYILTATQTAQRELDDSKSFKTSKRLLSIPIQYLTSGYYTERSYTNWNGPREIPYCYDDYGNIVPLEWKAQSYYDLLQLQPNLSEVATPKYAVISEYLATSGYVRISFYPRPDPTGDIYSVQIPYWYKFAPITEDGDTATNWFSENCATYMIWKAAAETFLFDEDLSNHLLWEGRAEKEFRRLLKKDKRDQFFATDLKPRTDVYAPSRLGRR